MRQLDGSLSCLACCDQCAFALLGNASGEGMFAQKRLEGNTFLQGTHHLTLPRIGCVNPLTPKIAPPPKKKKKHSKSNFMKYRNLAKLNGPMQKLPKTFHLIGHFIG